jgi:pentatricopeptide repeat protein
MLQDEFKKIEQQGLVPNRYSYSNLLNAHINSGDVKGAEAVFAKMKGSGFAPNVVVYTTMLKGYSTTGEVTKGEALLHEMIRQSPPVKPDVRTVNTFLRGCKMVGDVVTAAKVFARMRTSWRLEPDAPCYKLMARLLAQGLRAAEVERLRTSMEAAHEGDTRTWLAPCMFWAQGKCDRGVNCKFFHDPAFVQDGENEKAAERLESTAELAFNQV